MNPKQRISALGIFLGAHKLEDAGLSPAEDDSMECPECGSYVWNGCFAHCPTRQTQKTGWTTDYPTKPGYYWLRNYQLEYRGDSDAWPGPDLFEFQNGYSELHDVRSGTNWQRSELKAGEWFGPILPPEHTDRELLTKFLDYIYHLLGSNKSTCYTAIDSFLQIRLPPDDREYEYKEEALSGSQLAAEMHGQVPVMPQRNCYLDEDKIAVHRNGCIGDKCQLGHIQASIVEL